MNPSETDENPLSSPTVADAADRPSLFYRVARVLLRVVMPGVVRDHREEARLVEESGLAEFMVATAADDEFVRMKPLVSESRN